MKIDSKYIKGVLCSYYRFKKQCGILATECGRYSSDFLVQHKDKLIEIEVKVSKSDLNNDFKKDKHRIYESGRSYWTPHQFYFAVPEDIAEYAASKVVGTKYGLLVIGDGSPTVKREKRTIYSDEKLLNRLIRNIEKWGGFNITHKLNEEGYQYQIEFDIERSFKIQDRVKIVKRAKDLHSRPIDNRVTETIIKRMSSELANFYQKVIHEQSTRNKS